jgi:hypothetical protein
MIIKIMMTLTMTKLCIRMMTMMRSPRIVMKTKSAIDDKKMARKRARVLIMVVICRFL